MSERQDAVITLYSVIKDSELITEAFKKAFADFTIDVLYADHAMKLILQDHSEIELHIIDDDTEMEGQTNGMMGFFERAPLENEELMESVMKQISLFNHITGVNFQLDEQEDRTNAIMTCLFAAAQATSSIVLYPSMSLFTPDAKLLLSIEGESDLTSWNPIAHQSVLDEKIEYDEEDKQNFLDITNEIKKRGYPAISSMLPIQLSLKAVELPSVEVIARRLLCVFATSVLAECELMEGGSYEFGLQEFAKLKAQFDFIDDLSEREKAFVMQEASEKEAIQFSWRYECAAVLLWSLGLYGLDATYEDLCDVSDMSRIIRSYPSLEALCKAAKPRSAREVLNMHTRALYYDWTCVEARLKQIELEGLETGVVLEQHYALNWLCNANHTRDWDRISCNT